MNSKTLMYILKRILLAILTVWVVITVTFFVMRAVPGGPFMGEKAISEAAKAALEAKYGLDKPVMEQYVTYLKDIVTKFDFGPSLKLRGRDVIDVIGDGMAVSAKLGVMAAGIALVIGVVLGAIDDRSISELRYRGYCDALRDSGIPHDPDLVAQCGSFEMLDVYRATKRLIARCPDVTALFTISDLMAMAAIKALHKTGLQVPQDCSVISIDGIEMTRYTVPTLTSLVQPAAEMGTQAVHILTDVLEGRGGHCHLSLETTLREGETVVAPHL